MNDYLMAFLTFAGSLNKYMPSSMVNVYPNEHVHYFSYLHDDYL